MPGKEIKCRDRHFGEPSIHASKQHLERFPTQCDSVFSRSFLSAKLLIRLDSSSARISSQCSCSIWRDTISERSSSVSNPGNFTHFLTSPSLSLFYLAPMQSLFFVSSVSISFSLFSKSKINGPFHLHPPIYGHEEADRKRE